MEASEEGPRVCGFGPGRASCRLWQCSAETVEGSGVGSSMQALPRTPRTRLTLLCLRLSICLGTSMETPPTSARRRRRGTAASPGASTSGGTATSSSRGRRCGVAVPAVVAVPGDEPAPLSPPDPSGRVSMLMLTPPGNVVVADVSISPGTIIQPACAIAWKRDPKDQEGIAEQAHPQARRRPLAQQPHSAVPARMTLLFLHWSMRLGTRLFLCVSVVRLWVVFPY